MSKCRKCGEPVYFAEARRSLGFDWHRGCLRCEECEKVLSPGQHAEHKGVPYCHIPCYSALFGPKLFGHGSTTGSHRSFGRRMSEPNELKERRALMKFVREYNAFFDNNPSPGGGVLWIDSREVNGRLVLEGVLRVYWGVERSIRLREFDDKRVIIRMRRRRRRRNEEDFPDHYSEDEEDEVDEAVMMTKDTTDRPPLYRCLSADYYQHLYFLSLQRRRKKPQKFEYFERNYRTLPSRLDKQDTKWDEFDELLSVERPISPGERLYHTVHHSNLYMASMLEEEEGRRRLSEIFQTRFKIEPVFVDDDVDKKSDKIIRGQGPRALRRRHGKKKFDKPKLKRRSSINGHWYDRDTSVFTPPKDSSMCVRISSLYNTQEVLKVILDKYQVESELNQFALYVVKETGETRLMQDSEFPLLTRLRLGPRDSIAKIYVLDRNKTDEICHEVAQYLKFAYAELRAILDMFYEEEEKEIQKIKKRYQYIREQMRKRKSELRVHF